MHLRLPLLLPAWTLILALALGGALRGQHISNFRSVKPSAQDQLLHLPPTHAFQIISQSGNPLSNGKPLRGRLDFTGYFPLDRSGTQGRLGVNHESHPGGLTFFDLQLDPKHNLWQVTHAQEMDFTPLGNLLVSGTVNNCSGAITPWGTLVTCEEFYTNTDLNEDGYYDQGWCVEMDIRGRSLMDYDGDGHADKITAIGRTKHENVVVTPDSSIVYFGAEETWSGYLFKLVLQDKARLDSGALYTLVFDSLGGHWVRIPNTTQWERNHVMSNATAVGAYNWARIEDVDIGPDGKVYFTSTILGNVYRFMDADSMVADLEIFVQTGAYPYVNEGDTTMAWFTWPDNLAFDDKGNLWITQDGDNNHVWMARPGHGPGHSQLEVFMKTPAGCEPTGITFSPDYRYMFLSFQHPWGGNTAPQMDEAGRSIVWNNDATVVVARKEFLGTPSPVGGDEFTPGVRLVEQYPNPTDNVWNLNLYSEDSVEASLVIMDAQGRKVMEKITRLVPGMNLLQVEVTGLAAGVYPAVLRCRDGQLSLKLVVKS